MRANFLFAHVREDKRKLLFELMSKKTYKSGEVVIKQGEKGDNFYIVEKGDLNVMIQAMTFSAMTLLP